MKKKTSKFKKVLTILAGAMLLLSLAILILDGFTVGITGIRIALFGCLGIDVILWMISWISGEGE